MKTFELKGTLRTDLGKKATKAVCEVCGTTMFKIGGK